MKVRLLASLWNHTRPDMKLYLQSLAALNGANAVSVQVVRHLSSKGTIQMNQSLLKKDTSTAGKGVQK